ncbi:ImmA/IrrE family metallo-endopeptidase [Microbacterium sp. SORGH_AS_0969]|uniref:ImmA/IrrE family metallo-endopeptidase n=1 Tax=Microbacterium TaxID=33882 RepID=UPI00358ED314
MVLDRAEISHVPVDLTRIARLWPGLRISVDDIDGAGYLVVLDDSRAEILLRQGDSVRRRRFTLAHEFGHWVIGKSHSTSARALEPAGKRVPSEVDEVERWCDRFATSLLMPTRHISILRREVAGSPKRLAVAIASMPDRFDVSAETAYIRAWETLNIRGLLVRSRSRTIIERYRGEVGNDELASFRSLAGTRIADTIAIVSSRRDVGYATLQGRDHRVFVLMPR